MAKAYGLFQGVQDLYISYVRVLYPVSGERDVWLLLLLCILPAGYWFDRHDWPDL